MHLHIECILKRMIFFAGLAIWFSLYTKGHIFTDEGAYIYHSWRVSVGDVPYKEFFDHHAPLALFFLGSLFWLFGPSLQIAKIVMIGINLSIAYILYRICTRFTSEPMSLLGALLFSLISPGFLGMKFILEPFVILFTAASLLMFYRFFETDQPQYLGLAGLMSGFAILSK